MPEPYHSRGVNDVPLARVLPAFEASGMAERLRDICAGGPPLTRRAVHSPHPARGGTYANEMVVALPDASGLSSHVLYQVTDVTEQTRAQERITALADAAGGRVVLANAEPSGLTVTVTLPIRRD